MGRLSALLTTKAGRVDMKVKGWNPFYEGWLAFVFSQPFDESESQSWQDAWKMAEETGADFITVDVIQAEIEKGHIIVEKDSPPVPIGVSK